MAFFASAIDTLKILVIALGLVWAHGVVNLLEGYGNDNRCKIPGIKQFMAN